MQRQITIGICGLGRAGKDTAGEFLAKELGLSYSSGTSYYARQLVFAKYEQISPGKYRHADECWLDRHSDRPFWAKAIGESIKASPRSFYSECLSGQHFLTGIRWKSEFLEIRDLCDVWLWIDRPGSYDPTCEVRPEDCDLTVMNYGSLEDYYEKLRALARAIQN